ncbi:MAG: hypothetical protein U5K27_03615 [Desulfotignum sp.]|nr:hypothetical protein [Desulfotignum sp.]
MKWQSIFCFQDVGRLFPVLFINQRAWDKLPADQQAILVNAVKANTLYMRSLYAQKEPQALNDMVEKHGVTITHLPEEDIDAVFRATLEWLQNDFASKGPYCKKAANIVLKALKDFGRLE